MGNEKMEEAVEHYACVRLCLRLHLQVTFGHYILQRLSREDEKCSLSRLLLSPHLPAEHKFTVMAAVVVFVFVYVLTETQLIVFPCLGRH